MLFTDLVGSTELRGRLGEEAADDLRRKHDRLLIEAVEAHSGRVVKGLGDGIMAIFTGASDAVASAVAIQQAVDRLNRAGRAAVPLELRVGLSAAAGERRVALLAGEPGVGKTCLAAELAMQVNDQGGVVLAGRCDEVLGVQYQPFVEALRHHVDHVPPDTTRPSSRGGASRRNAHSGRPCLPTSRPAPTRPPRTRRGRPGRP